MDRLSSWRVFVFLSERYTQWHESYLVMKPMEPHKPGCSVVKGKDIAISKVQDLAGAVDHCWEVIMAIDLKSYVVTYRDSFNAQVA